MLKKDLKEINLPDQPGVYFFQKDDQILYIGKATSIQDRVKSYFSNEVSEARGPAILKMLSSANMVTYQETDSVLEALILETLLIKRHQPKYNTKEKDNKSFSFLIITKEKFPRVLILRQREMVKMLEGKDIGGEFQDIKILDYFGPFPSQSVLKEAVSIVRRIIPFRDKCQPINFGDSKAPKPCFNYQIGLCPGVCIGLLDEKEYKKNINQIRLLFAGKKDKLIKDLHKQMEKMAKEEKFEEAQKYKERIQSLQYIQDVSLLKRRDHLKSSDLKIEAYDVAHLQGDQSVGVLTVLVDGEIKKSDYRKFNIRSKPAGSDTHALKEILDRRLKKDAWLLPGLIVIDGGQAQKKAAEDVLRKHQLDIPVASVVKDDRHQPKEILGKREIVNKNHNDILLANHEAHRFAINFHRQKMRRRFK